MTILERRQEKRPPGRTTTDLRHEQEVAPVRDRYLDVLVALALVQIVTLHLFRWEWLAYTFPAMAVLFAALGAIVAGSLDRAGHRPWPVIRRRAFRVLPPLWLLGAVLVPLMLIHGGWTPGRGILSWLLPFGEPAASAWARPLTAPLWYLRAYLWFLLLTPAALWMFRRWPGRTLAVPLVAVVLAGLGVFTLGSGPSPTSSLLSTMATFGACWLIGFARHDGRLGRIAWRVVVPLSATLVALGALRTAAVSDRTPTSDDLGAALYCLGYVLLLLRLRPTLGWLQRHRALDRLASGLGARAVTIYVWANPAIVLVGMLAARSTWFTRLPHEELVQGAVTYALCWLLLGAAVVLLGWVEDLAACRRPSLLPRRPADLGHRPVPGSTRRAPVAVGAVAMLTTAALIGALRWYSDAYGFLPRETEGPRSLDVPRTALVQRPEGSSRTNLGEPVDAQERSSHATAASARVLTAAARRTGKGRQARKTGAWHSTVRLAAQGRHRAAATSRPTPGQRPRQMLRSSPGPGARTKQTASSRRSPAVHPARGRPTHGQHEPRHPKKKLVRRSTYLLVPVRVIAPVTAPVKPTSP